jgi:NAD(P)-dependent dehydrogenase (short-subunit alcohol dehydrogenase family)
VAGSGVTVNSVLPGPTMSDGFAQMMKDEVEKPANHLSNWRKSL